MIKFDKDILDKSEKHYLGFSGGVDSLASAHFLKQGGWDITLFHVRHFNTPRSDSIYDGVCRASKHLGLPLIVYNASAPGPGSEAEAFRIRTEAIQSLGKPVILCNHLNDLAETYFQNVLKGDIESVPLKVRSGFKVRPFLRTEKKAFIEYVQRRNLMEYVVPDDMPNQRQVLREQIFPILGQDLTSVVRRLYIDTGRIYT